MHRYHDLCLIDLISFRQSVLPYNLVDISYLQIEHHQQAKFMDLNMSLSVDLHSRAFSLIASLECGIFFNILTYSYSTSYKNVISNFLRHNYDG